MTIDTRAERFLKNFATLVKEAERTIDAHYTLLETLDPVTESDDSQQIKTDNVIYLDQRRKRNE